MIWCGASVNWSLFTLQRDLDEKGVVDPYKSKLLNICFN
jgi:hypothetical protein